MKTTALIFGLFALAGLACPRPLRAQLIVSLDCLPSGGSFAVDASDTPKNPAFAETSSALSRQPTDATSLPPKSALPPSPARSESSSLGTDAWTSRTTPTSIARTTVPVAPPLTDAFSLSHDVGAETTSLSSLFNQLTAFALPTETSALSAASAPLTMRERRNDR